MGGAAAKASPVPRQHAGSPAYSRLSARTTYMLRGQIYSRLMFARGDSEAALNRAAMPLSGDNVFDRGAPFQIDLSDYCLEGIELKLKEGRTRVLETGLSEEDGSFRFLTPLKPKVTYHLEATYTADRVYPERITFIIKVARLSADPLGYQKVRVSSLHHVNVEYQNDKEQWAPVDSEKMQAYLSGGAAPTLWLSGPACVVFDTHALDVPFLSQHRGDPKNPVYHTFNYHGEQRRIVLAHLCLATCAAMMLRYYGVTTASVEQVAEAAARFYLDVLGKRKPPPPGPTFPPDTSAGDIVRFANSGAAPHNEPAYIANGVASMLDRAPVGKKSLWMASIRNLLTDPWPTASWMIGLGWPMIVGDDLSGDYEHARVCHGLVVNHKKKIVRMYVNDPYNDKRWEIKADGTQSDLGWILMSRTMQQQDLKGDRMWHCGSVPAPGRLRDVP